MQASFGAILLFVTAAALATDPRLPFSDLTSTPPFFNPSLGQSAQIRMAVLRPESLGVLIVDQEGRTVRSLASSRAFPPGPVSLKWDGRDEAGQIVADAAYSVRVDWLSDGVTASYRPVAGGPIAVQVSYDREAGVLRYALARAGRVWITATCRPGGGEELNAVIVAGEPRPAGSVIEHWNGFYRVGKTYLPDQMGFHFDSRASGLPVPSLITVGNRETARKP